MAMEYRVGHEHQDHIKEEKKAPHLPPPAGEAVGGDGGHPHLEHHDGHHQYHAVPELQQVVRALEQNGDVLGQAHLVGDELQIHRLGDVGVPGDAGEHLAVVGGDLALGHEGVGKSQHRGQKKRHGEEGRQHRQDPTAEIPLFDHPSTSFPKTSSALNSRAMRATITMASSTAAEDIFW